MSKVCDRIIVHWPYGLRWSSKSGHIAKQLFSEAAVSRTPWGLHSPSTNAVFCCCKTFRCSQRCPSSPGLLSYSLKRKLARFSNCQKSFPPRHCPNNYLSGSCCWSFYVVSASSGNQRCNTDCPYPNEKAGLMLVVVARLPSAGHPWRAFDSSGCQSAFKIDPFSASKNDPPKTEKKKHFASSEFESGNQVSWGFFSGENGPSIARRSWILNLSGFMATPLFSVLVAVAFVTGFYDIAMVRQAVQQGGGHFGIAKHLRPFSKA